MPGRTHPYRQRDNENLSGPSSIAGDPQKQKTKQKNKTKQKQTKKKHKA